MLSKKKWHRMYRAFGILVFVKIFLKISRKFCENFSEFENKNNFSETKFRTISRKLAHFEFRIFAKIDKRIFVPILWTCLTNYT
jgi:hypothetical protein